MNEMLHPVLHPGNHDILHPERGYEGGYFWDNTLIDTYFPADRFPSLQGVFADGSIQNRYHTFRLGDSDYLIVTLEYTPRDSVLAWANDVVAAHPDHKVIVATHAYLSPEGARVGGGHVIPGGNYPTDIWRLFVRRHKNILMVLSGHIPARTVPYGLGLGEAGNIVYELLFDTQYEENGGNGWLGLLEFTPDNKIDVKLYSPYLGAYRVEKDAYGFGSRYEITIGKLPVPK